MGEVYKARDTRLTRTVAIKVLPADAATDASARTRFEREARVIATLSHPNICVVYDVGRHDDTDYLVMELLEGETLAERLAKAKGPLPLEEVLRIGTSIADALDRAHRAGIVHRDLKPLNVMLTKSGPKLLDFGLAKLEGAASPVSLSGETAATTAGAGTAKGTILGTIHYMAPEQVEGREADSRADIWAFGVLLYEMATGHRPFDGDSAASVIGAILKDSPAPVSSRLPLSPPIFDRVVNKCLAKTPDARWQSATDLRDELQWIRQSPTVEAGRAVPPQSQHRDRAAWFIAAAALAGVCALAIPAYRHFREPAMAALPETRTSIQTPGAGGALSFALSPDGRSLVFVSTQDGPPRLWLRPLSSTVARPLPGTEGATYPFWSPDGRSVGFFAEARLKRLDIAGGSPLALAEAANGRGGTWNQDGMILFNPVGAGLARVAATGGAVSMVTEVQQGQVGHIEPTFLPDGRSFVFYAQGTPETRGIYLGSLDGRETFRLTSALSGAAYLPATALATGRERSDGWIVWVREGTTLLAQPIHVGKHALVGAPITVADNVPSELGGYAPVSASLTGLIAYRAAGAGRRQLTWFDRTGAPLGTLGPPDDSELTNPELSPDGRRVAAFRTVDGNTDIWLVDEQGSSRFTFDPGLDRYPIWSPDGRWIVFDSNRSGRRNMYRKAASGLGVEELLLASDQDNAATAWSPDGRFLLYRRTDAQTGTDFWKLPIGGDSKPVVFLQTPADERTASFSPNGRWVAYQSNASGPIQIYLRPSTTSSAQWQISTSGGVQPRFAHDGRELYYLRPDGALMSVPMSEGPDGIQPGSPTVLFRPKIWGGIAGNTKQQYDVAPDGRFLVNISLDEEMTPITLLQNWHPDAAR